MLAQEKKAEESSAKGADKQMAPTADSHNGKGGSGGMSGLMNTMADKASKFMAMPDEEKASEISKKVSSVKAVTKSVNDTTKDKDNVVNAGSKKSG